ncbi:WYL domain-containing protein [Phormidesmis priestleyi ULC007]|uniref:WYL domain-containing protein n=1 Tax=Phormidesmis priestleyi ULC007 TaxID=1920490 RepID=A0A2T1DLF0_9CYAN|nr:WYL domain-containing protein [Phormidesmis priestleyi]PSB21313.1 WYL domain-containing protein [Phormidesmis priestleyi ULC007]PZO50684.1 MAG: WYL domain-containing protein [Phormidesmis priestleyi]
MPESIDLHPYRDRAALDRLLLLIATFVQHPGIGDRDPLETDTTVEAALELVQAAMQMIAQTQGIQLPHYSIPTLRKDLVTLRRYGILSQRRYRSGYYLGTGGLTQSELRLALNALASLAKYQGDPQARQAQVQLKRRLRGLDLELDGNLFYPVREHLNRAIVATDPDEMIRRGANQDTLFHQLEVLEPAICQGQAIELVQYLNPYGRQDYATLQIYPLQLIYHDVAWYLLGERLEDGHLVIYRMNRLKNYCKILRSEGRGSDLQRQSLTLAHRLLKNGWGLFLGNPTEQKAELTEQLTFDLVKVRFYPPVSRFIVEGNYRHPHQKILLGAINPETDEPEYVDYQIKLPSRSLQEFGFWLCRYMEHVQILAPASLAQQHYAAAQTLVKRYSERNN